MRLMFVIQKEIALNPNPKPLTLTHLLDGLSLHFSEPGVRHLKVRKGKAKNNILPNPFRTVFWSVVTQRLEQHMSDWKVASLKPGLVE